LLNCSNCYITEIPDTLINIKHLRISGIDYISNKFTSLKILDIAFSDIRILSSFNNLVELYCSCCPALINTGIRDDCEINSDSCNWINVDMDYESNIQNLKILQNWVRKNLRYWIFMLRSPYGLKMDKK